MTPTRVRAARHGVWVAAAFAALAALAGALTTGIGLDSHAYWAAWHHSGSFYVAAPEQVDAYLYSPAFAQVIWPLAQLPWTLFCGLWFAMAAAIYCWLLAPLPSRWRWPLLLFCTTDVLSGNVWSLFALVLVFGSRLPVVWALPLLTKITPGVGPLWFLVRRDWRSLAIALGATALIALLSFLLAPDAWREWVRLLLHPEVFRAPGRADLTPLFHPPPAFLLAAQLPVVAAVTVWAAKTDRPWLLAVAMFFASPVFNTNALVLLAAIPRMRDGRPMAHPVSRSAVGISEFAPAMRTTR
jgi:hypothetical protein